MWYDYGTGTGGDVFKFIKEKTGIISSKQIYKALVSMNLQDYKAKQPDLSKYTDNGCEIAIIPQPFTEIDKAYWGKYGITPVTLHNYNVFSCKYVIVNGKLKWSYTNEDPIYAYKVEDRYKIYRPFHKGAGKWLSSLNHEDIEGISYAYETLPTADPLIVITKSTKDAMVLREMGIHSIAVRSESTMLPEKYVENIQHFYKHIVILFDNDRQGMKFADQVATQVNGTVMFMPIEWGKDVSDCVVNMSFDYIKDYLNDRITGIIRDTNNVE
jgi:5S rRNA maturation endonuclease (ribonuclease M5)